MTISFNDSDSFTIDRVDVTNTCAVFVRDGVEVAKLEATYHFSDLDPEYHGLALTCLRSVRLLLPSTKARRLPPPPPAPRVKPPRRWWQFWRRP